MGNQLVLDPVEQMIHKINAIRDDPLIAMEMADNEVKKQHYDALARASKKRSSFAARISKWLEKITHTKGCRKFCPCLARLHTRKVSKPELMETQVLEKTIIKLGSLLALGFGEAGAKLISNNMRGLDTAGVDAMIPGNRVDCIIGYAHICHFDLFNEVLQAKVMTFVNHVAEIVHGLIHEYHGFVNKNHGDTFLIIWHAANLSPQGLERLADMCLVSYAKIIGAVHQSSVLLAYRTHPGLQQRLGQACKVDLSCGLHFGWAIEGAVGSEFKIDASYLSPNVSIAESVQKATSVYNVSILVSQSVVELTSQSMRNKFRLIDKVLIGGSKVPLELYVLDLETCDLKIRDMNCRLAWTTRLRFKARQLLEIEKQLKWCENFSIVGLFDVSPEVETMRQRIQSEEFQQIFKMGYQNYSQGEWAVARRLFQRTHTMLGFKDGPSGALLSFMEHPFCFEAPTGWQGVRDLKV